MNVYVCVLVACYSGSDPVARSKPSNRKLGPDPDLYSQSFDMLGDSKTDTRNDLEICAVQTRR